ncbi:hypothetical protein H2200_010523 [Cladophialophora chaetospira]|uniref:Ankyrin n=1 Tax=Cladophialophora chaetospira TaxID=386627 RepID=A0AA38X1L4_9EURO|nr:hypothetical protein H2200_010523 [Cladophialophora chaetospira]
MAEIIGVVSGISGLIGLTFSLGRLSYEYINTARGARQATSDYLQEVLALGAVLVKLQESISAPTTTFTLSTDQITLLAEALKKCQSDMEKLQTRLERHKSSTLRSLAWPFQERETKGLVEMLHRWRGTFDSVVSTGTLEISKATLLEVRDARSEAKRSEILDWVLPNVPNDTYAVSLNKCCPGTCSWILDHKAFKKWSAASSGVLACCGGPGVGKTILSSFVVEHLKKSPDCHVLYHYFDFRPDQSQNHTPAMVARNVLRQLLQTQSAIPDHIVEIYDRSVTQREDVQDWIDVCVGTLDMMKGTIIVLDGLDESPDPRKMVTLVSRLVWKRSKVFLTTRPNVNLETGQGFRKTKIPSMTFTAPPQDLEKYVQHRLGDEEDLDELLSDALREDVARSVVKYADGVFLLCKMAIDSLSLATTARQVRQLLASLPKDLPSAYENTFQRILGSRSSVKLLALRTLSWLHVAKRPLRVPELLCALAIEPDDDHIDMENITTLKAILNACQGLIECSEADGTVRLAHATVQDFLNSQRNTHFADADHVAAHVCVIYLNQDDFAKGSLDSVEALEKRMADYPLLEYAACYWGLHAAVSEAQLAHAIDILVGHPALLSNASHVLHYARRKSNSTPDAAFAAIPRDLSELHVLAFWGLVAAAKRRSSVTTSVEVRDSLGWTPLHWAAARGHSQMIDFLLDNGAQIETQDPRLWTPLFWSAFWRRPEATALLLNRGARIQARDVDGRSPLHIAISRASLAVCKVLIDGGADTKARCNDGYTAAEEGQECHNGEVRALFGASPSSKPPSQPKAPKPALELAANNSNEALFQKTLIKDIEASKQAGWENPFDKCLRALSSDLKALEVDYIIPLTSFVPKPDERSDFDQLEYTVIVLWYAILAEREDMVRYLINYGMEVREQVVLTFKQSYGGNFIRAFTPLHLAVYRGSEPIVRLLLSHGADPAICDYSGKTPLHYAAVLGNIEFVKVFLSTVNLINKTDDEGETPLHQVCEKLCRNLNDDDLFGSASRQRKVTAQEKDSTVEVFDLLISGGADIHLATKSGVTPLMVAAQRGHTWLVRRLLQAGADPNAQPSPEDGYKGHKARYMDAKTPFTLALMRLRFDTVQVMLENSTVLLSGDTPDLSHPLKILFEQGRAGLIKQLWDIGFKTLKLSPIIFTIRCLERAMDPKDGCLEHIFWETGHQADPTLAPDRYLKLLQVLVDAGEDVNSTETETGETPLLLALRHGYCSDMVPILLDKGADMNARNQRGLDAMHCAALSGDLDMIKLVSQHDVFVNKTGGVDDTTVSYAAFEGHVEVVEYMVSQQSRSPPSKVPWIAVARLCRDTNSNAFADVAQHVRTSKDQAFLKTQNGRGRTLLHDACDKGTDDLIEKLLDLGSNPNLQDNKGDTALHVAARKARGKAIINLLVQHGGDIRIRNNRTTKMNLREVQSATGLHIAVHAGHLETIEAILDAAGALKQDPPPPSAKDDGRWSQWHRPQPPPSLIDLGAAEGWYSTFADEGTTALMIAVGERQLETVRLLIERGANVNIMGGAGSGGRTALDHARERGDKAIVDLIVKNRGRSFEFYDD